MEQQHWRAKPLDATVLTFDGSFNDAKAVKDAVEAASLVSVAVSPLPDGEHYSLYIPTPGGTQLLSAGDVVVERSDGTLGVLSQDRLAAYYEQVTDAQAEGA